MVGAGGWQYFIAPEDDKLKAYSRLFDFVEVNVTFYRHVSPKQAASWRSRVREEFVFTVRCSRVVTHVHGLNPSEQALQAFEHSIKTCKILRAPLIILETPPTLTIDKQKIRSFFSSVKLDGVKAGLEIRGRAGPGVFESMKDYGIVHVTDFSKTLPRYFDAEIAYSRLFGKGLHNRYMFDDGEIAEISEKADGAPSKKTLLSFHGLRMYVDAARMKVFRSTGEMAPVTNKTGVESFREAVSNAVFPASRRELITRHGWKLFDVTAHRRARVSELLNKIPEKTYESIGDLLEAVEQFL